MFRLTLIVPLYMLSGYTGQPPDGIGKEVICFC